MNHKEEMDVAFENCLTYLRRRGRLPFRAASFGPVDNLILSLCAYDPFEWVLPGVESGVWLPFSQAVEKLIARAEALRPKPIREQMANAAKEAAKENAARPTPAKGKEARDDR